MPDESVPLDTLQYTRYHRQLASKNIIINSTLHFIDDHRKQLQKDYPDFETYHRNFVVPQSLVDTIMNEGKKTDVKPKDDEELQRTLPYLREQLRALIARDLWDMTEYFTIMNEQNHTVQRALEVIGNQ